MSVTPTFVGSGSDYAEPTPWYKNHTVWLVGGGAVAIVVFFYLSSQNSATGTTAAVAAPTSGTTSGTNSANLLAAIQQMNTNDSQILAALQSGQTGSGTTSSSTTGSSTSTSTSGGGTGSSTGGTSGGSGLSSYVSGGSVSGIGGPGTQFQSSPQPSAAQLYNGEVLSQSQFATYNVPSGTQFHFMGSPYNSSTTGVVQLPGESLVVPKGYVNNPNLGLVKA